MKKINNKGFALVETLIVTAFVVGIFSVMYANFYPMMGEYEKRENYDDISSIYNANLFKILIEKNKFNNPIKNKIETATNSNDSGYAMIDKNCFSSNSDDDNDDDSENRDDSKYYDTLATNLNVEKIYLLPYTISNFKTKVKNNEIIGVDTQTKEYIDYLPEYKSNKYNLGCRIIVKYKTGENREIEKDNIEYKFATIGVDCK